MEEKQKTEETASPRAYPLWCVDRGADFGESQYLGPFDTRAEALEHQDDPDEQLRRCRQVLPSECLDLRRELVDLMEIFDEAASSGGPPAAAWADFEEIIEERPSAKRAFEVWADDHLTARAFVCEGDEPGEVTQ